MEWSQQEVEEATGLLHEIVDLLGDIKALLTPPPKPQKCPGEEKCPIFSIAYGDTPIAKSLNACACCPLFSSKPIRETHGLRT